MVLLLILVVGSFSYYTIPKERNPEVQVPTIYVSMYHEGISPEDAERLLVRPMEKELRSIEGVKEMTSNASQDFASVTLEFHAGFDSDNALQDVREKVDLARPELPDDTDEPTVHEVVFSQFPVLNVILTGNAPERSFIKIARDLQDKIEAIPAVLEVNIAGDREEAVEVIIRPEVLESYKLSSELVASFAQNNLLIAAGSMDTGDGAYVVKVPGLLETVEDIMNLPVKQSGEAVIRLRDIAEIRKSFKDRQSFARVDGQRAIVLEVSKRSGENIINTIDEVRRLVDEESEFWPENIEVIYSQDVSQEIKDMLVDLQNNILFAVILVLVVIIGFVGIKSGMLVAFSIPGSFLTGILTLTALGLTMNIVVLFSLILSIGMLVDSAIVVIEYANRRMIDGDSYRDAYKIAAKRMAWPIIASTITTLIVFAPLLFWPGIVGQFMMYMPLTLIATLTGSLLMALIFMPTIGTLVGHVRMPSQKFIDRIKQAESGSVDILGGFTGGYLRALSYVTHHAWMFIALILTILACLVHLFMNSGLGVEFFPDVEPDNAQVIVHARGNLSVHEKNEIMRQVESRILDMDDEIDVFYARAGNMPTGGRSYSEDTIGAIMVEFADWQQRRKAAEIMEDIRRRTSDMYGVYIETAKQDAGPSSGKPVEINIGSRFPELVNPAAAIVVEYLYSVKGLVDIEDNRPIPAVQWNMEVDRAKAARFGVSFAEIGNFIKLITNGLRTTDYRPDDSDDEVDVLIRFPYEDRELSQLERLRVVTPDGAVPVANFITRRAEPKTGNIKRVDGMRVITAKADIMEGVLANDKVNEAKRWIENAYKDGLIDPRVRLDFKGEDEDQKETQSFLSSAFLLALFCMALVLVTQFNSIYDTVIIMSAVFLSTGGVLLGLLVTAQPFGIVMCGVGTIALAGIVVNNNIIFIDTYNSLRAGGMSADEAIMRTGAQRLRPILLTAGTTVLGLLPMVIAMNIDFISREVTFGAPSTQWWQQLSTSIAGGLTFATILTLFFTPCLLIIGERFKRRKG